MQSFTVRRGLEVADRRGKESDWESELERFTTARLQEVAKSIFNDQRLIYSNILPPYVELSPSSKCQNVTP